MADEQDAAPSRVGQAGEPQFYLTLAMMPDGNFAVDGNCLDKEMIARALLNKGAFEVDRYFGRKAYEAMAAQAKDNRVITGMLGPDARAISKRMRGLR